MSDYADMMDDKAEDHLCREEETRPALWPWEHDAEAWAELDATFDGVIADAVADAAANYPVKRSPYTGLTHAEEYALLQQRAAAGNPGDWAYSVHDGITRNGVFFQ